MRPSLALGLSVLFLPVLAALPFITAHSQTAAVRIDPQIAFGNTKGFTMPGNKRSVWAPAGYPAPGGWSVDRLRAEMEAAAASGRIVGMSLCCGNPRIDPDGRSASAYVRGVAPLLTA